MSAGELFERLDELAAVVGGGYMLIHEPGMRTPALRYEVRVWGPNRLRVRTTAATLDDALRDACEAVEAKR